jgi:serine/threonine protein kinase
MVEPEDRNGQSRPARVKAESLVGKKVGFYEIMEKIGKGGMSVVYRAYDRSLDRDVALKILPKNISQDPEFEKRFVREARGAAKLDHPGIVQIFAAGKYEDFLFIAMQYIDGETLAELIKAKRRFGPYEALSIILQVADALEGAHKMGIIHRDIKPSNIMIEASTKKIKVMDFGLSRSITDRKSLTRTHVYLGTPEYSSPEQCQLDDLDERTDIYSLGAVLYEMLTGRVPHVALSTVALFRKIVKEEPLPMRDLNTSIPPSVVKIVQKMMSKDKKDRYPTVSQLKQDILAVLPKLPREVELAPSRKIGLKTIIVAGLILVILGIGFGTILGKKHSPSLPPAPGNNQPPDNSSPPPTITQSLRKMVIIYFSSPEELFRVVGKEIFLNLQDYQKLVSLVPYESFQNGLATEIQKRKEQGEESPDIKRATKAVLDTFKANLYAMIEIEQEEDRVSIALWLYRYRGEVTNDYMWMSARKGNVREIRGLIQSLIGEMIKAIKDDIGPAT